MFRPSNSSMYVYVQVSYFSVTSGSNKEFSGQWRSALVIHQQGPHRRSLISLPNSPPDSADNSLGRPLAAHRPTQEAALPQSHKGIPIGELLVRQGVLTQRQVAHILTVQKSSHRPFGDLAERLYGVCPKLVEDAWVQQYVQAAGITDLEEL